MPLPASLLPLHPGAVPMSDDLPPPPESPSTPTPSRFPGMGATPYADDGGSGVSFRVWAPHAEAVAVAGSFNGQSMDANPLAREENGTWSADVPGAKAGDEYKFVVTTAG